LIARQITAERQSTAERIGQPPPILASQMTSEDVEQEGLEVARYSEIPQFDASILDTFIPRCRRLTQLHFGAIVSNPHAPMAFKEKMGYNMTYNMVPPGHGNALHMHRSIEIFVALDGKWEIAWGMQGEHTVVLEPWDFVCVPARVCHSYKNVEEQTAQNIMTILPGKSWITWAPNVVTEARENGAQCDDNGVLTKYAHLVAPTSGLAADAGSVEWRSMGPDDMLPFLHRFSDRRPMECRMTNVRAPDGKAPFIEMFWKTIQPEASNSLPRRSGVDLLLVVLEGSVLIRTASGRPVAAAGRLDAVRVPTEALAEAEVVVFNPCPSPCVLLVVATEMRSQNDMYFHLC
jgi:mannose-6-phosphate isomerase-like protein (cupin superfamily)